MTYAIIIFFFIVAMIGEYIFLKKKRDVTINFYAKIQKANEANNSVVQKQLADLTIKLNTARNLALKADDTLAELYGQLKYEIIPAPTTEASMKEATEALETIKTQWRNFNF